jgi:uncharacterized OB-fold protein
VSGLTEHEPAEIDADSRAFWDGVARGRLVVSRCRACGHQLFPPIASCANCGSRELEPLEVSGDGEIYSWATVHLPLSPEFADEVPYTVVVVQLSGGGRLFGRLLDHDSASPVAGAGVQFETYWVDGRALPGFRIAPVASTETAI